MKRGKNVFWGILFLLGAAVLIIGSMGYFEDFNFFTVFATVCLTGILVDGIAKRNFATILFSIALLIIVYDRLLGLEAITPWPVLGAALLGSIGLNMLFPAKKKQNYYYADAQTYRMNDNVIDSVNQEEVVLSTKFGTAVKYITCQNLSRVNTETLFSTLTVYFDNAGLKNQAANVYVNNSFATTILYIPASWKVEFFVNNTLGTTQEKGHSNPVGDNVLNIYGDVLFGLLDIRYI